MRAIVPFLAIGMIAMPAVAATPDIQVTVGSKLKEEARLHLGSREVEQLTVDLKRRVERELARTGTLEGARLELVLVDVKPNRPTLRQMTERPGLSFASYSVGGAAIEGRAIAFDGTITPIRYKWYESDIRNARDNATWGDADTAFSLFSRRLGRGETYATR